MALGLVGLVYALPLVGLLRYQGPPMEEGFMLAFPQQILAGRLPHRDFLHLYGPGSLWLLAGVFKIFGDTLEVQRLVGLAQLMAIGFGVFALARPWGRRIAVVCGAVAAIVILPPTGLSAMAWNGAVGLGLVGLAVGTSARRLEPDDPRIDRRLVVSGVLAGAALLFRPDLVVAIALANGVMLHGLGRRRLLRFLVPAAAVTSLYLVLLATSGFMATFEGLVIDPVFRLRPGRTLPMPPSWSELDGQLQRAGALRVVSWPLPMPALSKQVFIWFFLTPLAAIFVAVTGFRLHRRGGDPRGRTLLTAGMFAIGILPQAVQRPDTAHFAWVSCVGLALVPLAVRVSLDLRGNRRLGTVWRDAAGIATVAVVLVGIIPFFSVRTYADITSQSFGRNRFGFEMTRGARRFYYGNPDAAADAQHIIDVLDRESTAGERLLVAPVDMRKTPYSDAFFYYLFPELPPATRFIEMDPGLANADDSPLADEVLSADWIIRSDIWSVWDEPNESRRFGPDEPNRRVEEHFCSVESTRWFELMRRCET